MSATAPLRVLVIEDDEDTRANLRDILELDDHDVSTFASVAEALRQPNLATISVVVIDRRLPDGNAEDLIPDLKAAMPTADVIVVTGHADVDSAIRALRQGAADYIVKPINPDVLRASLARTEKQIALRGAKERSEANFRELIEAMDFMILILTPQRIITYANQFASVLTGYPLQSLVGQPFSNLLDNGAKARVEIQFQRIQAGGPGTDLELPIRGCDQRVRWILWSVKPLEDFEGQPALVSIGKDVTERRALEQRALQSERLAAIGQMVTGLAHESRNALQRSQACLEVLKDELDGQVEPLELVGQMERAQHHLHHLYEEVRGYAAPIVLHRQRHDLGQIWRETWRNLSASHSKKQLSLTETVSNSDVLCAVDAQALEQVFRNVFENAIHVSQPGDRITIECREVALRDQPAIEVCIRDQGPGLNSEQAERIFEPFYTTKTQGTGLGMAITKRIVEAHGGTIELGSQAATGAEIVITLPRVAV